MKIYIELLFLLALIIMFVAWRLWYKYSLKRIIKNFNPNDVKSRKCEDFGTGNFGERGIEEPVINSE